VFGNERNYHCDDGTSFYDDDFHASVFKMRHYHRSSVIRNVNFFLRFCAITPDVQ